MAEITKSDEYLGFRSSVPQKKVAVDGNKTWTIYEAGPRCVISPLVCLPPVSGRADVYFRQILALSSMGYRVIAVDYPVYWTLRDWCEGLRSLLDHLSLDKVHLFGASLGGFLAQKFAEHTHLSHRVASLILCNAFIDTSIFHLAGSATTFWMMPALMLKKMVMANFDKGPVDTDIADSIDFMVTSLDSLSQQELACRLTLNCVNAYIQPQKLSHLPITLIDVYDDCALSQAVKEEMYKSYPEAKRASLKDGGNFPYLSRCDEVNLYIQIHLRQFWGKLHSALDPIVEVQISGAADEPELEEDNEMSKD